MRILVALFVWIGFLDCTLAKHARHPTDALKRAQKFKRDAIAKKSASVARHEESKRFVVPPDSRFLTNKTRPFAVDGVKLPELNFDPGESYAGLLPISGAQNETREYFFWFWPSLNSTGPKEIVIWFNGGPGCSSLVGFLTENGPFTWQDGTAKPVQNTYDWRNLTNVMWVEQPIGVGFTQGTPNITDELAVGSQFVGFYEQFAELFDVKGWDIYLTGESYAGYYLPYMADAFIKKNNSDLPLKGVHINDPIIGDDIAQQAATAVPFAQYWQNMLGFNDTILKNITTEHEQCGYKDLLEKYFTFPAPQEQFPLLPRLYDPADKDPQFNLCDTLSLVYAYVTEINQCFSLYRISDTCPRKKSVIGQPTSDYNPDPTQIYFNRSDVQQLIHVPIGWAWETCSTDAVFPDQVDKNNTQRSIDLSPPPATNGVLQHVIETTNNVIIGSGNLDALINTNGTLLAIQNMTWNGWQGFRDFPGTGLYAPDYQDLPGSSAGSGYLGKYGHERGLTFYQIQLAGHMVPGDAPSAMFSIMEVLLGRISPDDLGKERNFTTELGNG